MARCEIRPAPLQQSFWDGGLVLGVKVVGQGEPEIPAQKSDQTPRTNTFYHTPDRNFR